MTQKKQVLCDLQVLFLIFNCQTPEDMFASSNRKRYARNLLIKPIEKEIKKRERVTIPSDTQMQNSLREVLEEMADAEPDMVTE